MVLEKAVVGLIFVIIGVLLITALAPTINETSSTNAFNSTGNENPAGALENVSGSAATLYALYDFIWAVGGLVLIVVGVIAVALQFKKPFGK